MKIVADIFVISRKMSFANNGNTAQTPYNVVSVLILQRLPKLREKDARPRGYKTCVCSTQLSTKFILLINVKMPTIVGILTFISMTNTISKRLKARNFFSCQYFSFYEQLKFRAQLS